MEEIGLLIYVNTNITQPVKVLMERELLLQGPAFVFSRCLGDTRWEREWWGGRGGRCTGPLSEDSDMTAGSMASKGL